MAFRNLKFDIITVNMQARNVRFLCYVAWMQWLFMFFNQILRYEMAHTY